jgi:ribose-phosphate pyrophosphokinase
MIKVNNILIEQGHFPDGTLLTKFDPYNDKFKWQDGIAVDWHYENDAELFTLICVKRHLDHFFGDDIHINLWMPYVPHARMDRVKNSDEIFTLKYFCEVINSLHFNMVFITDVHSNVTPALLDHVVQLKVTSTIERVIDMCGDPVLFYPDEGAMKRYSTDIARPCAFGIKRRDWTTGKIQDLYVMNGDLVKGKDVLIVDDICSYGGTFYHSAKALKALGANNIYLYITHCETSVFDGEMINSGLISKIYTTDSIFPVDKQNDMIKIVR